ncbi:MAG: hypothetical protein AAGJ93_11525 [Bacteroidota bacterium]
MKERILRFPKMIAKNFLSHVLLLLVLLIVSCQKEDDIGLECSLENRTGTEKIKGASILQTWIIDYQSTDDPEETITSLDLVEKTNSNWVSLSPVISVSVLNGDIPRRPYLFPVSNEIAKMRVILPKIRNSGLDNVMLKPLTSFWPVDGSTFWGDFYVETEEEWLEIEHAYEHLIYEFAKLSLTYEEIKLLSIGTELAEFAKRRPLFFENLILKLRNDFPLLKLTYAANWDEYEMVSFWPSLDYIGVNPYFPLINEKEPTINEIEESLMPIKENLSDFSCEYAKPILFTEYGFRSIDYGLWEAWNLGDITSTNVNFDNQANAYTAFYNTFWQENWLTGGFFWEWKIVLPQFVNDPNENGWYVNDKPAQHVIKSWYE